MNELVDKQFVAVVGKGGVGKTVTSTIIALQAAQHKRSVLIVMCNVKENLSKILNVAPIGPTIANVLPHIDAVNVDPVEALREYGSMVLKIPTLYKALFENRYVSSFLRAVPGLHAWAILGKAYFHATDPSGHRRYDTVILDSPSTGHSLDMFRVPKAITHVAPPGLLRHEAEQALRLFHDAKRSAVIPVTILEETPVNETIELAHSFRKELGFPLWGVVVNKIISPLFTHIEKSQIMHLRDGFERTSSEWHIAHAGYRRALHEVVQHEHWKKLVAAIDTRYYTLPRLLSDPLTLSDIKKISGAARAAPVQRQLQHNR